MRSLAVLSVLAGCTITEPLAPGTATVALANREGIPLANWPVVFHDADGSQLAIKATDARGLVTGPMDHDGMVTYRSPFPNNELVTRGGVQLGDVVIDGGTPAPIAGATSTVVIATPGAPEAARLVRIDVICGDRVIEQRGVPGTEIAVTVPSSCPSTVFAFATAADETAQAIAYDVFTVERGHAIVPQWRTDFTNAPATIVGLDDDLVRFRVEAEAFLHGASIVHVIHDGDGSASTVTPPLRIPAGIPGASKYRLDAVFETGELVVEQELFPETPFVVGPTDLPPRITAMTLDGDAIAVTTERAIDERVEVDAVLVAADASWRVRMPGPIVRLPDVDVAAFPQLPYFSLDTVELAGVALRYRHDNATLTTAMPFVRD
jgi:hypothetical protein